MKSFVLFLVLLLPACSILRPSPSVDTAGTATGSVKEPRKSKIEPQPAARPVPDEVPQPVRRDPIDQPPRKNGHIIEED